MCARSDPPRDRQLAYKVSKGEEEGRILFKCVFLLLLFQELQVQLRSRRQCQSITVLGNKFAKAENSLLRCVNAWI